MIELSDFNDDALKDSILIDEQPFRGRVLKFKLIYDVDSDAEFDEIEYFGDV